jgi:glycogen(starch) synthase
MKLFAALGGGDIVGAQRLQQAQESSKITETSITFSGQLYEFCRVRGIQALFTSHHTVIDALEAPPVILRNVPRRWETAHGWRFHASRIVYAIRLARMARSFGADLALIDSGTAHYFALIIFRLVGIPVAVNFHNVRWPQGFKRRGLLPRVINGLDSWFFRRIASGATGCSPECGAQARSDGADHLPYFGWCPQFRSEGFVRENLRSVRNPFRVLFAGRIERNKGVFDLIKISTVVKQTCSVPVIFEICGAGSELAQLRKTVEASPQADQFIVRGRLERADLLEAYGRVHAVIVPTRGDFAEGMPLVCAEAVLTGLPIVTSRLSNALPVMGEAIAEAEPEDIASYAKAICRLAEDDQYYRRLCAACLDASYQFLDREKSYPAAVDRLFASVYPEWKLLDRYGNLFDGTG